ncbi:Proteasome subunit alpha type-2-A [Aduncisulcus paluster]|uniref:Proteasome subunit alpha type n=1 Tax=Aduncisulcus paluster TaxID=2918883 RepID=A0ABQ5KTT2_9EUKA|nr:Proteasome subunit alpha type-2-A [Aduncisulcus paluster]
MQESAYSFSLTTFSPSGKLGQIDHAFAAVAGGSTSIGIKAVDGVVLAAEKKIRSELIEKESVIKVAKLSKYCGVTYAGMGPDFRVLLKEGRKDAEAYRVRFGEECPVSEVSRNLAQVMQEYTQSGGVRPFGCSLLVIGKEADGKPGLFQVDPSGSFFAWKAACVGHGASDAQSYLEKRYEEKLGLDDAIHIALLTLQESFDGKLTPESCEIGVCGGKYGSEFRRLTMEEIDEYLS